MTSPSDLDLDMASTFAEVPMLVAEVRRLRARVRELEEALDEATRSLETASRWANDDDIQRPDQLRPWLRSRALVARAALGR